VLKTVRRVAQDEGIVIVEYESPPIANKVKGPLLIGTITTVDNI
jgi:hypothetical protein